MNEIYWGKIINDGFHYRLPDDTLNNIVLEVVLGNVKPVPWLKEAPSSHVYYTIENGNLFATRLITSVLDNDIEQIFSLPIKPIETKEIAGYRFNASDKLDLVKLTYELHVLIPYDGELVANQIFVDEIRYPNGGIHKETSNFVFNGGMLDTNASVITKSYQTTFEDSGSLWHDDIPKMSTTQTANTYDGRRRYFVNPIGNMRSNNYIIDVVCMYLSSVHVSESSLDWIFSHDQPVLRTHLKREVSAGSGLFEDWKYDLIEEARKQGDIELMGRLLNRLLAKVEGR